MDIRTTASLADILTALHKANFEEKQPITYDVGEVGSDWRVYARKSDEGVMRIVYVSDSCELLAKDTFASSSEVSKEEILKDMLSRYNEHRETIDRINSQKAQMYGWAAGSGAVLGTIALRFPGFVGGVVAGLAGAAGAQTLRIDAEDRSIKGYLKGRGMCIGDGAMEYIKSFEPTSVSDDHRR